MLIIDECSINLNLKTSLQLSYNKLINHICVSNRSTFPREITDSYKNSDQTAFYVTYLYSSDPHLIDADFAIYFLSK